MFMERLYTRSNLIAVLLLCCCYYVSGNKRGKQCCFLFNYQICLSLIKTLRVGEEAKNNNNHIFLNMI